ncbi:MAG TPA: TrbI/VirB10 family protein [Alphaproteobacteria bacterium]|nr:TrbI/VirB10 family protein [Alphaproteobacteria bacterium]
MANTPDDGIDSPDFDDPANADLAGFEDTQRATLGDLWRNNQMVKVGVILAAFAIIVGGIILFGGSAPKEAPSSVPSGNEVSEPPATAPVSKSYEEALKEGNIARTEEAIKTGGSVLPTPIEPPRGRLAVPEEDNAAEDPLQRWRRLQEERARQEAAAAVAPTDKPKEDTRGEAVNALAQLMSQQMESVLGEQVIEGPKKLDITTPGWLLGFIEEPAAGDSVVDKDGDGKPDDQVKKIIVPAGTILYAQMITEANTDAPGPVLAQIVSGPLNGSRILGEFKTQEEFLTLNFKTVVIDGVGHPVNAVALDPDTTLPGMATDVNHRYLKRIVLPMAASFVEGMASAISESGTTSITINGSTGGSATSVNNADKTNQQEVASGIEEAGSKLSELISEEADKTRVLIRVERGTPMGILFLDPVTEQ